MDPIEMSDAFLKDIHQQLAVIQEKLETLSTLNVRQEQAVSTIYEIKRDLKALDEKYNALSREVVAEEATAKQNTKLIWALLSAIGAGGGLAFSLSDFFS